MATHQTTVRFKPDDLSLIDALSAKLGVDSRTQILRIAIRKLAEQEAVRIPSQLKPGASQ